MSTYEGSLASVVSAARWRLNGTRHERDEQRLAIETVKETATRLLTMPQIDEVDAVLLDAASHAVGVAIVRTGQRWRSVQVAWGGRHDPLVVGGEVDEPRVAPRVTYLNTPVDPTYAARVAELEAVVAAARDIVVHEPEHRLGYTQHSMDVAGAVGRDLRAAEFLRPADRKRLEGVCEGLDDFRAMLHEQMATYGSILYPGDQLTIAASWTSGGGDGRGFAFAGRAVSLDVQRGYNWTAPPAVADELARRWTAHRSLLSDRHQERVIRLLYRSGSLVVVEPDGREVVFPRDAAGDALVPHIPENPWIAVRRETAGELVVG